MRLARRALLRGAGACLVARGTARAAPLPEPGPRARAEITRIGEAFVAEHGVPGLCVAFGRDGHVGHAEAFGVADVFDGAALTPAHRFRIASIAKPITAVAIFRLIDAGRIALDSRVLGPDGVLGETMGAIAAGSPLRDITIHHLLTHRAGGWPNDRSDPLSLPRGLAMTDIVAAGLRRGLDTTPGEAYAYSNFGYLLLGRVIERVTGRPYEAHVRGTILEPAGAGGMAVAASLITDRRPDEVRYHGIGHEEPYGLNLPRMDASGGWTARADDLVRFAGAIPTLLSAASMTAMSTATAANPRYACGWNVNASGTLWHGGSLPGTTALLVRTARGLCWSGLVNARNRARGLDLALDRMLWTMVRAVPDWRA
jgi:CubicO group peptidase (beta-lactamase class C family)